MISFWYGNEYLERIWWSCLPNSHVSITSFSDGKSWHQQGVSQTPWHHEGITVWRVPPLTWVPYFTTESHFLLFTYFITTLTWALTDCGLSSKLSVSPYIVGGGIVNQEKNWPWMLPIYYAGEFQGAGVHIGQGFVLTAGHIIRVQRLENGVRFIERYADICISVPWQDKSLTGTELFLYLLHFYICNQLWI